MKIRSQEKYIMQIRTQRGVLSRKAISHQVDMCAPPSYNDLYKTLCQNERTALCVLKGSLTVEAALVFPFFLMILLAFFAFFSQYASAAEAKREAAAEAKQIGIAHGILQKTDGTDIIIYQSEKVEQVWINPFRQNSSVTERAVCRAWIGFTELETQEVYVYITPEGSVYHLNDECTHLKLSVQQVTMQKALGLKNEYGEKYDACELCEKNFGVFVYITSEGSRYHSKRSCSGLKRTIRHVPLSSVKGRRCCLRCTSREEL